MRVCRFANRCSKGAAISLRNLALASAAGVLSTIALPYLFSGLPAALSAAGGAVVGYFLLWRLGELNTVRYTKKKKALTLPVRRPAHPKASPIMPPLPPEYWNNVSPAVRKLFNELPVFDDLPMLTAPGAAFSPRYEVPAPPVKAPDDAQWIPQGQSVTVWGVTVPGGFLYVGKVLSTALGFTDPCLVNTSKPVAAGGSFLERQTNYWPSYSEISPVARHAYLAWLAQGRCHPDADMGYVQLYFYGLERRVVADTLQALAAQSEWPAIIEELHRLVVIYGRKSASFKDSVRELLTLMDVANCPAKLYNQPVPVTTPTWELPMHVKLALGQTVVDAVPVPAHLALAWVQLDPQTSLRTPATRCRPEFEKLFKLRYAQAYGPGLALPMPKAFLKFAYRSVSPGLRGRGDIQVELGRVPNVTVSNGPISALRQLASDCTDALDAYSRLMGRNLPALAPLDALLQLPVAIWPDESLAHLTQLRERVGDGFASLPLHELLEGLGDAAALSKDKAVALARALAQKGLALEPLLVQGTRAPTPDTVVVLFAVEPDAPFVPTTPAYELARTTLQLGSVIAAAQGPVSPAALARLQGQALSWTHLSAPQVRRLTAHAQFLATSPASLASLKSSLARIAPSERAAIGQFLAALAQVDGHVSAGSLVALEKAYRALGLEPECVFSDVHAAAVNPRGIERGATSPTQGFSLDTERIAALHADTQRVGALLASIFTDEPSESTSEPVPPVSAERAEEDPFGLAGLDPAHRALVRLLASEPSWSLSALREAAAPLGLMLDGALEHINEAAFDAHDIAFTEGEDPLAVNPELLEQYNT